MSGLQGGRGAEAAGTTSAKDLHLRKRVLAGEGSNLQPPDPKSGVLPVELPAKGQRHGTPHSLAGAHAGSLGTAMGSLIKKRRKRMRKKKHKKMLKATRWQRRAGK